MVYKNFLAPIHDYTDAAFRLLCQRHGAEAACVPLVSSAAIANDGSRVSLIDARPEERNLGVQLFGSDAPTLGKAAGEVARRVPEAAWLNLNCGCPSTRTISAGAGCAMLERPGEIARAVSLMKKESSLAVSAKIRIHGGRAGTVSLCRRIEEAGADFIIIHGRTVRQGYSGAADWELIRDAREGASIPIVGNGDIASLEEGRGKVKGGYCDSFMVGRAAMRNPLLFSGRSPRTAKERFGLLREYIGMGPGQAGSGRAGQATALRDLKLKAMNFLCGIRGASRLRRMICAARNADDILGLEDGAGQAAED